MLLLPAKSLTGKRRRAAMRGGVSLFCHDAAFDLALHAMAEITQIDHDLVGQQRRVLERQQRIDRGKRRIAVAAAGNRDRPFSMARRSSLPLTFSVTR